MRTDAPSRWFRMYAEFSTDPKVQMLSEADQRRYMMLLCLRCGNGDVTLHDESVTFMLRITETEWQQTKDVLLYKNLITADNKPTAWEKRQYASDSSAERVSKHRAKKKQQGNSDVTLQSRPVEAEIEAEIDKDKVKSLGADKPRKPATKAASLPADFYPNATGVEYADQRRVSIVVELESFRNWHQARGSTMKDWQAAWRTWCDKAVEFGRAGTTTANARASPQYDARSADRKRAVAELTGVPITELGGQHERVEREINPTPRLACGMG